MRRPSTKRRAAVYKGDPIRHIDVFERDNWTCWICGEAINPHLRGDNWWRATLDHVVPITLGGPHTWDNVRTAHLRCNQLKGDTILPVPPGIITLG